MLSKSNFALILCFLILVLTHLYYPKWKKERTEATLSWDVSGYYMYLPATFIYHDLKHCAFKDSIMQNYYPTPDFQQAYLHESGNYVMKYSLGQALAYSPFFFIAHSWASLSNKYQADGFSKPYQFWISFGSLIFAFIGLFYLRKILIEYFSEIVTSITLLGIVIGTTYMNYAAIDGPMAHNLLFTIYCLLIYATISFYKNPNLCNTLSIGFLVGLATLTRPTEFMTVMIPILWGLNLRSKEQIKNRVSLFKTNFKLIFIAIIVATLVILLQSFYWKYATGDWIVYSYQDQGFSWLSPHLYDGFFSFKAGWLIYTPFMIFSLIGFYWLSYYKQVFHATLLYTIIFIYVTFAWDIWWYGGSLGQRAMVQSYPILAFPLAAFISQVNLSSRWVKVPVILLALFFIYCNLWWIHQAHKGGKFYPEQITKEYFFKVFGTNKTNLEDLKLLDTDESYDGKRYDITTLYTNNLNQLIDSSQVIITSADSTEQSVQLDKEHQWSPAFKISDEREFDWYRAYVDIEVVEKEWDFWKQSLLVFNVKNYQSILKVKTYRVQRFIDQGQKKRLYIDIMRPDGPYTEISFQIYNSESNKSIIFDNVKIEGFNQSAN